VPKIVSFAATSGGNSDFDVVAVGHEARLNPLLRQISMLRLNNLQLAICFNN
jgi:hypothetical protein